MNKPSPAPEPSMEEILASIRRIISDGEDPAANHPQMEAQDPDDDLEEEPVAVAEEGPEDHGEPEAGDVLDLTEEMFVGAREEVTAVPEAPAEPTPGAGNREADVVFGETRKSDPPELATGFSGTQEPKENTLTDWQTATAHAAPPQATSPQPKQPEPTKPASFEDNGRTEAAGEEAIMSPATDASVAAAFGQLATNMLGQDSRTIEDLVSELLRPMLREWLDDNLPPLVERLVKAEIERVSRGR